MLPILLKQSNCTVCIAYFGLEGVVSEKQFYILEWICNIAKDIVSMRSFVWETALIDCFREIGEFEFHFGEFGDDNEKISTSRIFHNLPEHLQSVHQWSVTFYEHQFLFSIDWIDGVRISRTNGEKMNLFQSFLDNEKIDLKV